MNISHRDVAQLDSTQGELIKRLLSIDTELFQAMNIKRSGDLVSQNACSIFSRYVLSLVLPEIYVSTIFHVMYSLAMYVKAPY